MIYEQVITLGNRNLSIKEDRRGEAKLERAKMRMLRRAGNTSLQCMGDEEGQAGVDSISGQEAKRK